VSENLEKVQDKVEFKVIVLKEDGDCENVSVANGSKDVFRE
jgi:hypothetical protein